MLARHDGSLYSRLSPRGCILPLLLSLLLSLRLQLAPLFYHPELLLRLRGD